MSRGPRLAELVPAQRVSQQLGARRARPVGAIQCGLVAHAHKAASDRLAGRRSLDRVFREALEADAIVCAEQAGRDPFEALSWVRYGLALAAGEC